VQEYGAERSAQALRALTVPRALVVRAGQTHAIDAADLTLFRFADAAEATWDALVEQGLGKAHDGNAPELVRKDI
jgi:hypothetical protein